MTHAQNSFDAIVETMKTISAKMEARAGVGPDGQTKAHQFLTGKIFADAMLNAVHQQLYGFTYSRTVKVKDAAGKIRTKTEERRIIGLEERLTEYTADLEAAKRNDPSFSSPDSIYKLNRAADLMAFIPAVRSHYHELLALWQQAVDDESLTWEPRANAKPKVDPAESKAAASSADAVIAQMKAEVAKAAAA